MIEQQPVFAPPRQIMQADAQGLLEQFVTLDSARFFRRDQAAAGQFAPALADAGRARDPEDGLQVAQAACAFLDVGLEVGFLKARVALLLLELLCLQERCRVEHIAHAFREALE